MARRKYRKYDQDFKQGAVALALRRGSRSRRWLGINEGTLGKWVAKARRDQVGSDAPLSESERAELARLRKENTELRRQRRSQAFGGRLGGRGDSPVAVERVRWSV